MSWGVLGCLGVSWGNETDRVFGVIRRTGNFVQSDYPLFCLLHGRMALDLIRDVNKSKHILFLFELFLQFLTIYVAHDPYPDFPYFQSRTCILNLEWKRRKHLAETKKKQKIDQCCPDAFEFQ